MTTIAKSRKNLILETRGALSTASEALAQAEAQHSYLVAASKGLLAALAEVPELSQQVTKAMEELEAELKLETEDVEGEPLGIDLERAARSGLAGPRTKRRGR